MKLTVPYELLENAVSLVNSNPTPTCHDPIVGHVLIETDADAGTVILTKTDMELQISATLRANIEESGNGTVDCDSLAKILKTYKNLKKKDDCNVSISRSKGRIQIGFTDNEKYIPAVLASDDKDKFAPLDVFENESASCEMISDHLADYVEKCLLAINKHESNIRQKGLYLKLNGEQVEMTSTNREEVALVEAVTLDVTYQGGLSQAFALVPRKALEAIVKVVKGPEKVTISIASDKINVHGENEGISYEIIHGTIAVDAALEARSQIPNNPENVFVVPTAALKNALAHLDAITDKSQVNRVRILVEPNVKDAVILSCRTPTGEIPGLELEAEILQSSNESRRLIVSDKKLANFVKTVRSKNVKISFNQTGKPYTLQGTNETNFTLISSSIKAAAEEHEEETKIAKAPIKKETKEEKKEDIIDNLENFSDLTDIEDLSVLDAIEL